MYLSTTFITPVLFLLFVTTPASSSGIHIQLAKHSQVHKNEGIVDREVLRRSVDNSIRFPFSTVSIHESPRVE